MFGSIGCVYLSHVDSDELEYVATNNGSDESVIALGHVENADQHRVVGSWVVLLLEGHLLQMIEYVAVYFLIEDGWLEQGM